MIKKMFNLNEKQNKNFDLSCDSLVLLTIPCLSVRNSSYIHTHRCETHTKTHWSQKFIQRTKNKKADDHSRKFIIHRLDCFWLIRKYILRCDCDWNSSGMNYAFFKRDFSFICVCVGILPDTYIEIRRRRVYLDRIV